MKVYKNIITSMLIGVFVLAIVFTSLKSAEPIIEECTELDRLPSIDPDYTGIVIPPNIAPLTVFS